MSQPHALPNAFSERSLILQILWMAQWVFLVKKHVYEPEAQVHNTHIVLSRMVSISWSILLMGPDTIKRPGKGEFGLLELICLFFLPSHICTFDFEGWGGGGGRQGLSD